MGKYPVLVRFLHACRNNSYQKWQEKLCGTEILHNFALSKNKNDKQ